MAKAAATAPAKGKKSVVRADFTGVDSGGITVPEGEYIVKVKTVKLDESDAGNDYLAWELKVRDGKHVNKTLYHNTSLSTQSLWATKRWLETLGVEVPDGELEMDLAEYVDMEIGVIIEHDTWKGRVKARIVDCFPAEGEGSAAEGDEGTTEVTEEEVNEMDKSELKALVKERGLDVELVGSLSAQRKLVIEALGEATDEPAADEAAELPTAEEIGEMGKAALAKLVEEHELDVELTGATSAQRRQVIKALADKAKEKPAAATTKAAGKKGKAKVKASEVTAADEAELTEIIEKYELDVDLDAFATLRKKRGAVTEALEGIELLEDDE
jgi:hypothetical protein